jgi:hypothetical protein
MLASLKDILEACDLTLTYETGGYVMAKEKPGKVAFPKLVELEILFDRNKKHQGKMQVDFVAKNEELPLQIENHCSAIFSQLQQALNKEQPWEPEVLALED